VKPEGLALVTGAGRGLGRALALELARRGFEVLATMRDVRAGAGLAAAAGDAAGRLRIEALDVTRLGRWTAPEGLRVLVNNAGVETAYLPAEHAPLEAWRAVFETNVFGLVDVTRRAIPALRAAGGGAIVNVTSSSLLFPMPFYAAYRASKAAVQAFGESLAAELRGFGIRVLEVLPGPVETDMLAGSDRPPEAAAHAEYAALARWAHAGRQGMSGRATPAAEAARRIADALLDDASPLRLACDDVGAALIAGADAAPHQARLAGALGAMPAGALGSMPAGPGSGRAKPER
jgi:NAD(P)-dependent dehydrogenase (short-subunit alcohol dehydrogenase family)